MFNRKKVARARSEPIGIVVNHDKCGICGCCVSVCPPDCITLRAAILEVDNQTCTGCMKCVPVCPTHALTAIPLSEIGLGGGARNETPRPL